MLCYYDLCTHEKIDQELTAFSLDERITKYLIELINVNFLKRMRAAKLVDLVVDFIVNPCFVITNTIIEDGIIHILSVQPINHLQGEGNNVTALFSTC